MHMNERQKMRIEGAFLLLAAGARKGRRMVADDATVEDVRAHLREVEGLARDIGEILDGALGAVAVLGKVDAARGSR